MSDTNIINLQISCILQKINDISEIFLNPFLSDIDFKRKSYVKKELNGTNYIIHQDKIPIFDALAEKYKSLFKQIEQKE